MEQNTACTDYWNERNKNAYNFGQYGGTAKDTYYIFKKGDGVNTKPIKTFKFTKENRAQVQKDVYEFLDRIGGTRILEMHKFLHSFSTAKKKAYKPTTEEKKIEVSKIVKPQLSLF